MILIFGGTTEGRIAVRTLEESGKPFYYSTKGEGQDIDLHHGIRLSGAMQEEDIFLFCRKNGIQILIDAAHPFAEELHKNVAQTARRLDIPAIRLERLYPPTAQTGIIWCTDYADAMEKIRQAQVFTLLALTGVQSIAKLKPLWTQDVHCYFRILDRDSSRQEAARQGFPPQDICYYRTDEDDSRLLEQLHPDAILLKESGGSGGFAEKVAVARSLDIPVFAIHRPLLPSGFLCADGEHGLRRLVEQLLPDFFPLRSGLTTGTCAAAAAVAATWNACNPSSKERPAEFPVRLPDGETIYVAVNPPIHKAHVDVTDKRQDTSEATASVIKDAGDDPDITNGMEIRATVSVPCHVSIPDSSLAEEYTIRIQGGEGVGTVTMPGLGLELGSAAINATPRRMIEENIKLCLSRLRMPKWQEPVIVTISVPGGEEIARRTFNPRLGIEGGISIIGTSGIVKPFSSEAFVNSIRKSMEVARATGSTRIVISSGAKSERYIRAYYPDLPVQAFVHYGNFIGETLKIAADLHIPRLTLGMMIGKAVKLAEGNLDTHSKKVVMNKTFIRQTACQAGCRTEVLERIENINLARELWEMIPAGQLEAFCRLILKCCHRHCDPLLPDGELTLLLIDENGEIYT